MQSLRGRLAVASGPPLQRQGSEPMSTVVSSPKGASATAASAAPAPATTKKLGVFAMTLLVISAMFGGGVYNIPQNMAQSAALGAVDSRLGRVGARHLLPRPVVPGARRRPPEHDFGHLHVLARGLRQARRLPDRVGLLAVVRLRQRRLRGPPDGCAQLFLPALFQGRQHVAGDHSGVRHHLGDDVLRFCAGSRARRS